MASVFWTLVNLENLKKKINTPFSLVQKWQEVEMLYCDVHNHKEHLMMRKERNTKTYETGSKSTNWFKKTEGIPSFGVAVT